VIRAEGILLAVCASKDRISSYFQEDNKSNHGPGEVSIMINEIASLKRIGKGNPSKIPKRQHESEAISCDIHCREDRTLAQHGVEDVPRLKRADEDHRVGHMALHLELLQQHRQVDDDPPDQPRSQLAEILQIERPPKDSGIQLVPDEKIVNDVACVSTRSQTGFHGIGSSIKINREDDRQEIGGGEELGEMVVDPRQPKQPEEMPREHRRDTHHERFQRIDFV